MHGSDRVLGDGCGVRSGKDVVTAKVKQREQRPVGMLGRISRQWIAPGLVPGDGAAVPPTLAAFVVVPIYRKRMR